MTGLSAAALLAWAAVAAMAADGPPPRPFADGETVAFIGDSITHDGRWHRHIADFYATRFPDRSVVFVNAGLSGDTAAGALRRLDDDVLPWHPTTAVIMLGMNDCGREAYRPGSDGDAGLREVRERSLRMCAGNLALLAGRLAGPGRRIILVSPSPYEDAARLAQANLPGANAALGRLAAMLPGIATPAGAAVVDLHAPMTALGGRLRSADPSATPIGPDRVHPAGPGHLVMAWLFLAAQGLAGPVSRVRIDVPARSAAAENADVGALAVADRVVSFTVAARSLPFPIPPDARPALAWAPIAADLCSEDLVVSGLAEGSWRLSIDGQEVLRATAAGFAAGVDLADSAATPQRRQAAQVQRMQDERRAVERRLRAVAMVRHRILTPEEAAPERIAASIAARLAASPAPAVAAALAEGRDSLGEVGALRARCIAMSAEVRAAARPSPHTYRLERIP